MPTSPLQVEAPLEKLQQLADLKAANEKRRRSAIATRCKTPGEFAIWLDPTTRQTPALEVIDRELAAFAASQSDKLALYMAPQEGKSERAVRRYVTWRLSVDPTLRIAIISFEQEMATRWGRQIKRDIEDHPELGIRLRADSTAAGRWETEQGGGVYCVGIKGALTGRPVDEAIVDDPVKDRAAAESKIERGRSWDFWENVLKIRARKTLVIQTRWHTDDLSGRLETREPGEWRVVKIPAICDDPDTDPLGRELGEEMTSQTPDARPPGWFKRMQATMSAYVFSALFQQSPTAGEGNIFKRGDWRFWEYSRGGDGRQWLHLRDETFGRDERHDLNDCQRFITIDLATSTRTSADFTVAAAWAITVSGDVVLLGRVRARVAEVDHAEFVEPLRSKWLGRYDVVHIEAASFGTTLVYALGRAGVPVAKLDADVDKVSRAMAAAGLVRQHKVWLPRDAEWLDEWLDEHADFDKGTHDDQVDVMAYAARVAIAHWLPQMSAAEEFTYAAAAAVAPIDLMSAPM